MLGPAGLCLLTVCLVSQCSARLSVTIKSQDYSYATHNEALLNNMKKVLSRMAAVQKLHPRLHHLYELLKQDLGQDPQQDSHQVLDFNKTLRPKYDGNSFRSGATIMLIIVALAVALLMN